MAVYYKMWTYKTANTVIKRVQNVRNVIQHAVLSVTQWDV